MKILIVGLGLIGGSILKALQNKGHDLYGMEKDHDVINTCLSEGYINEACLLEEMDIIFVCLYPDAAVTFIRTHQDALKSGSIITDVSGLKKTIMDSLSDLRKDIHFIGGHPMAGKEGKGFDVSDPSIFHGANYLLTHQGVPEHKMDELSMVIKSLGCGQITVLDPGLHDEIIAYTSHMPHVLSAIFMGCNRFDETRFCVAGSFRDMTRVSDINSGLWSELLMENRSSVLREIAVFKQSLDDLSACLLKRNTPALKGILENAREKKSML